MLQIRIGPRKKLQETGVPTPPCSFFCVHSLFPPENGILQQALPPHSPPPWNPRGFLRELIVKKLLFVCLARKKWEPFVDPHPTILRNAAKLLLGPNAPYTPPCFVHYKTEEKGTTDCFFPPFLFSHTPPPSPQNPLPSPGSPRRGFLARSPSGKPARLPRGASLKKMLARNYALGQPM